MGVVYLATDKTKQGRAWRSRCCRRDWGATPRRWCACAARPRSACASPIRTSATSSGSANGRRHRVHRHAVTSKARCSSSERTGWAQIPLDEAVQLVNDMARRSPRGARQRDRPPRSQARERDGRASGDGASTRWSWISGLAKAQRHGKELREAHGDGDRARHAGVHESRATARQSRSTGAPTSMRSRSWRTRCSPVKLPFEGRTQQEIMIARLKQDPAPLYEVAARPASFPRPVDIVLEKAMRREPEDRYADRRGIRRRPSPPAAREAVRRRP